MRLFLAVELSDKIKKEIEGQLTGIKKTYPQFQWIPKDNYHITVNFFGEVKDPKKIINNLENILYDKESFYFYSTTVDLFIRNKITIYLSFKREKTVEKINENVSTAFQLFKNSEKFTPHLTLARYKIPSKQQYFVLKKRLTKMSIDISFKISQLILFESIFEANHSVYKKIHSFKLL